MDSAERKRKLLLGGALIATLIAVILVEEEETMIETVENIQPAQSSADRVKPQENNSEYLDTDKLGQRKFNPLAGELFVSTTWTPRQPPVSLQEQAAETAQAASSFDPPPAPTAPPLPFKYNGKAIAENETWVFLSQAGENHITRIGGEINDQYRLDSINDDIITMTYLPLNIKQTLTINNQIAGNIR